MPPTVHGLQVPLADVFNHKVSLVTLGGDYRAVEEEEGEEEGSSDEEGEQEEEEDEGQEDDSNEGEPHPPAGGASLPTAPIGDAELMSPGALARLGVDLRLEIAIVGCQDAGAHVHGPGNAPARCAPRRSLCVAAGARHVCAPAPPPSPAEGHECLQVVAAHDLGPGEVHNTYGEHGDAELLSKYGFCLGRCEDPGGWGGWAGPAPLDER